MSIDSGGPKSFENLTKNVGFGEQEFVELHAQGITAGGVLFTDTYRNGLPGLGNFRSRFHMLSGRVSEPGFAQMITGLRVICADSTLTNVRVLDVNEAPRVGYSPGKITITELSRDYPEQRLKVRTVPVVQDADGVVFLNMGARSVVKRLLADSMTGVGYLGLEQRRLRMDLEQLAEFDLPLDVFVAIGTVAVEG